MVGHGSKMRPNVQNDASRLCRVPKEESGLSDFAEAYLDALRSCAGMATILHE